MSSLNKPIDYKILESELDDALKADELYKLQNDAKIRAIEQRVPTYDDFRNLVQAAHLRPMERSEIKKKVEVSWNHCFSRNIEEIISRNCNKPNARLSKQAGHFSENNSKPQTNEEFLKIWKHLPDFKSKFEYLLKFRHCLKDKFFKIEVPSQFLEEFSKLGVEICSVDTVSRIIEILQIFSECNRFSLSLAMMSVQEKNCIQHLFKNMLLSVQNDIDTDSVKKLMQVYCVSHGENDVKHKNTN